MDACDTKEIRRCWNVSRMCGICGERFIRFIRTYYFVLTSNYKNFDMKVILGLSKQ